MDDWLAAHPNVANAIRWQYRNTTSNGYTPIESDKVAYPSWDAGMRQLLRTSFEARYSALCRAVPYTETLLDPPNNVFNAVNDYFSPPYTDFTFAHSRDLYVAHVAHSLAIEIGRFVPWSITTYDASSLAILVDSASMMAREPAQQGTDYAIGGAFSPYAHPHRDLNRGWTIPAPPSVAYRFMRGKGPGATQNLVSRTRYATIVNLMQWARDSMDHFYGPKTYVNFELTWGYHGLPPVTRILSGTTSASPDRDPADPPFQHWTAGCGGTAGFFRDVLRTVNIPVVVPRVCGHHQIYFPTEGRYLDHGDAPYSGYGSATFPVEALLIDEATYVAYYGANVHNEAQNEPDDSVHCKNVGRHTDELLAGTP